MHIFLLLLLFCLFLPGCNRYASWARCHVIQAEPIKTNLLFARRYLRTERLYHQLDTVGIFDVLWLAPEVRRAYVQLYAARASLSCEEKANLQAFQDAQVNDFISFYVLVPESDKFLLSKERTRGNSSLLLKVDGCKYKPVSIELVELLPEYEKIFSQRFMGFTGFLGFSKPYLVKFKAVNLDHATHVELILSTVDFKVSFKWHRGIRKDGSYSYWH